MSVLYAENARNRVIVSWDGLKLLFLVDAYCSFRVFLWKLIFLHIFIWFKISSLSQKWPHLQEDLIIKCLGDNDVTARTLVSNLAMFFAIISNFNWPYVLTILAFNFIDYRFVSFEFALPCLNVHYTHYCILKLLLVVNAFNLYLIHFQSRRMKYFEGFCNTLESPEVQMMQQIFNERSVLFLGCDPERPEYKNFFEKFAVHSKVLLFF